MKTTNYIIPICLLFLVSCVPSRLMEEEKAKRKTCETDMESLRKISSDCETANKEMRAQITDNDKVIAGLKRDSSILGANYRNLTHTYDKLNRINEQLQDRYNKLIEGNAHDTKKLAGELHTTQEELLKKQDELKQLEKDLNAQKLSLDNVSAELKKREARVNELESILKKKDDAVNDLKKKVQEALFGFENKGLTITQKNGKIYVSLDESLLFASGSTKVESKGEEALKKLAKVLEQNADINILVEGHTDDVPMKGAGDIKDNWDLSVMRATSIVKILTKNSSINSKRLTAAGRGEYYPIDEAKTPEARKRNRRTEIILTPKLDELFKVLETN